MADNNKTEIQNLPHTTLWAREWNNVNWDLIAKLRYPPPHPLGVNINTNHLAKVLKVKFELEKNNGA